MKILFVRHAETDWNKANRFQGIIDIDISEHGKRQANLLSEYLYKHVPDINKIYTSPLKRTKHTAMLVAKKFNLNITALDSLIEYSVGVFAGKNIDEMTTNDQYDEFFHISLGEKLIEKDPWMVYCGVFEDGDKVRAIIYSGEQAAKDKKAGDIAKTVSEVLGGAGGGNQRFAQGGGKDKSKKNDAIEKAKTMVLGV